MSLRSTLVALGFAAATAACSTAPAEPKMTQDTKVDPATGCLVSKDGKKTSDPCRVPEFPNLIK